MSRFLQVDLTVDKRVNLPGKSAYYVILQGSGIEIQLFHTMSYFTKLKKYTVNIVEQE